MTLSLTGYSQDSKTKIRNDFKKYYEKFNVAGSFVLFDPGSNEYVVYNPAQRNQQFIPASTFKICNAMIGLETGVIKDENFVIPWDSVVRQNKSWNGDQNFKTAFANSVVWYFQELARRVGGERMNYWIDTLNYGNRDTSGGIDRFWLTGGLRITPQQQIDFLVKLHDNKLPVSERTSKIVKHIMIVQETTDYIIRAKSGWGIQDNKDIGWYVGYIESKGKVYYFANCIQSADPKNNNFAMARIDIVTEILKNLKITN